ncbi:MAG: hypothetical protein QMD88_00215 [Coprothermobacterota bacterium]|nr:hypothetical protein [Coprothermobacterota bacterium]
MSFLELLEQVKTRIGKLTVKAWPVDHSVPGAFAYGIETSSGWVIYTGDLRRHGKRGDLTIKFAEEVQKLKPLALIIEGTRVSQFDEGSSCSEDTVKENVAKIISSSPRLVIADFGPRNVERLISFFEVSKDLKRKLVITLKDLALLKALSITDPSLPLPEREPSLLVLQDVKVSRKSWESDLLQEYRDFVITCQDVRRHQGDFVLCFSYYDLQELVDIEPQGGVYISLLANPLTRRWP